MSNYSRDQFDVLVVGGGPAGIAAAVSAAQNGARVGLVDENVALGGQIWRGGQSEEHSSEASSWLARLKQSGVIVLCRACRTGQCRAVVGSVLPVLDDAGAVFDEF